MLVVKYFKNIYVVGTLGNVYQQHMLLFVWFDLIIYVPSRIFQLYRGGSSWVEPVLS